jgi:hypothetical protein
MTGSPLTGLSVVEVERIEALLAAQRDANLRQADRLTELVAERDRLRAALRRIADGDVPGVTFADDDLISAFAQEALDA